MLVIQRGKHITTHALLRTAALLCVVVLLAACGGTTNVQPTPTPAPLQFTVLNLGIPQAALNAPITGSVPDSQVLHVGVTFKLNQDTLNKLKNVKPQKGKNGDLTGLANQLGITDEEYQRMKAYFGVENATLNLGKLHTYLTIDAKAGSFARLLQTKFVMHKLNGKSFYTPDPSLPPKLPTPIASQIQAITGLDNYGTPPKHGLTHTFSYPAQGHTQHSTKTARKTADACSSDPSTVSMAQVAHAYSYDAFWNKGYHGENMTVNFVETDTYPPDDINAYFSCVGFSPNHFNTINIDGGPTQIAGESVLDIEMVSALAPGSTINDYQTGDGTFQGVNDALQQIVNDNANNANSASVVSISLGLWEGNVDPNARAALDSALQQLTQVEHMTVFVSSGDCGAFIDEKYNDLSVSYPASSPLVVAVGGTKLAVDGNGNRSDEVVWSNGSNTQECKNQWGSGGGVSTIYDRQDWQHANGTDNQYSDGKRQLPDISAIADNIAFYIQGNWSYNGGTSAAAPIWAAGMALTNQALIKNTTNGTYVYGPDLFYTVANKMGSDNPAYFDVVSGNNLYYQATPGWDNATGLGTPNLANFYNTVYQLTQSSS